MKNKKFISSILSVCIALSVATVGILSIFAAVQPTIYSKPISANAGQTVRIPILISYNSGLAGAKLQFSYDETKLTPTGVESGDVFNSGLQDNIDGDAQPGSFNVYWASPTGDNVSADGVLFYINFDVQASIHESTYLNISYDKSDTFDENFNDVELTTENVFISIYDPLVSAYVETSVFLANQTSETKPKSYDPGEEFSVQSSYKVNGVEWDSITYQVFKLSFDSSAIEFVGFEMENGNLLDSITGTDIYPDNIVFDTRKISDDVTEDDVLSAYKFRIKDDAQPGDYNITLTVEELGGAEIDASYNTPFVASVNFPNIKTATNVYIPSGTIVEKGQSVSVPVMINNNKGIMGYRLSFTYNTSDLRIVSVSNGEDFGGNISDSIGNKDGSFDVVWSSTENKTSNSTLLYLNFDVVSTTTDKAVESQIQINYTYDDTFDENYEDVQLNCANGVVVICPGHTYTKSVVAPSCNETGYSSFECNYCSTQYFDEYAEPVGHYYIYQGNRSYISNISYTMDYRCKDCDELYSSNGDEVLSIWSNNPDKYINSRPSRNVLNSQMLDANNDNFINAKDYAMIYHSYKAK